MGESLPLALISVLNNQQHCDPTKGLYKLFSANPVLWGGSVNGPLVRDSDQHKRETSIRSRKMGLSSVMHQLTFYWLYRNKMPLHGLLMLELDLFYTVYSDDKCIMWLYLVWLCIINMILCVTGVLCVSFLNYKEKMLQIFQKSLNKIKNIAVTVSWLQPDFQMYSHLMHFCIIYWYIN